MESAHEPCQPGKLHRLPDGEARKHGENSESNHRRIRVLLQRVVSLPRRRLRTEEEIVPHHRPDAEHITWNKKYLPIIAAEQLVAEVEQSSGDVDPHEGQVPLQCAAEPSADRKGLRPIDQIVLRNLGAEARERTEDLQAASDHYEERDRVDPMTQADDEWMLIDDGVDFSGLCILDCHRTRCHRRLVWSKDRRTPSSLDLPSSRPC